MKVSVNTSKLQAQLEKLKADVEKRLGNTAKKFATMVTIEAINATPLGDADKYAAWYKSRFESTGLRPEEGLARGGWYIDVDGVMNVQFLYGQNSGDEALNYAKQSVQEYVLGDTIMIANTGPYIEKLENNYSKQTNGVGIAQPTIETVMRLQAYNLDSFYKGT